MKNLVLISSLFLSASLLHAETLKGAYDLKSSKVEYVVKYLIKKADGASTKTKGKGECNDKGCDFLVAAPVKSFESKDSNRDFNMLKATKAEKNPMVIARIKAPAELGPEYKGDVEIEFAGVKHLYPGVVFKTTGNAVSFHAEGLINVSLINHKIEKPSLLGVEIEDQLPITITADWIQRKN